MKKGYTRIAVILDKSGSMQSIRQATINGFNEFLQEQKKLPGTAKIKLVQFSTKVEDTFDIALQDAPELTEHSFVPSGMTALLDAQGKTITALGKELADLPESERPETVLVVTITDGDENSSVEYRAKQVKELVTHQTNKYNWKFVYLGANQDAIETARNLGIGAQSAMNYSASVADPMATVNAFTSVSNYAKATRSLQSNVQFSAQDRAAALDGSNGLTPSQP